MAVTVDTGHVADKDEAFFAQFTLVLLSAPLPSQAVRSQRDRRRSALQGHGPPPYAARPAGDSSCQRQRP